MADTKHFRARYFRLAGMTAAGDVALPQIDFGGVLRQYGQRQAQDRMVKMDSEDYLFEPRPTDDRHLAVHKTKKPSEFLTRLLHDGSITEVMAVDDEGSFADTSCLSFLPWGNIVGLVTANQSAPRIQRVAQWLSNIDPLGNGTKFVARPLVTPADFDWMGRAEGARRVTVKMPIETLDKLTEHLGSSAGLFSANAPGADVTLQISYGKRTPKLSEGAGLLDVTKWFVGKLSGARASASVYRHVKQPGRKGTTRLEREVIELVEHELCHEFTLGAQEGAVRIDATLSVIDQIAAQNSGELRRAWEVGSGDDQGQVAGASTR